MQTLLNNNIQMNNSLQKEDITPQVYAAFKNKINIKIEPTRVEEMEYDGEKFPILIAPLGKLKGVMPVYETGIGIFNGTKKEFMELSEEKRNEIKGRMIGLLTAEQPLPARVIKIEGETAVLSRKKVMEDKAIETLKRLHVEKIEDAVGKIVTAAVIVLKNDGAIVDIGGFEAFLPRFEIDYTNPYPARALGVGSTFDVKIISFENNILTVSRKALLPDPWDTIDYKEGTIARAIILKPQEKGVGYVVAFEPGITGIVRNYFPYYIPKPFEKVAVRIDVINREKRYILGRIISL